MFVNLGSRNCTTTTDIPDGLYRRVRRFLRQDVQSEFSESIAFGMTMFGCEGSIWLIVRYILNLLFYSYKKTSAEFFTEVFLGL